MLSRVPVTNIAAESAALVIWPYGYAAPTLRAVPKRPMADPERADYLLRFGNTLRRIRKAAGKTQQEVADKLKVDVQTVSRWENGHFPPDAWELAQMVEMFEPPAEAALALFRPPQVPVHELDALLAERAARGSSERADRLPRSRGGGKGAQLRVVGPEQPRPRKRPEPR